MRRPIVLTLAAVFSFSAVIGAQIAVNDLFDRASSGNLGADWIEQDGDAQIVNNALQGNSPFSLGWATHTTWSSNYAVTIMRVDWAMNGGGGDRVSLIAGVDPNTWQGIELRIADNDGDGLADRVFFNAAVNAGNWYGGSYFVNITTPLAAGRATLWFSAGGDTVNLLIEDATGANSQLMTGTGILALPPTGTAIGLGYFGNGRIDNLEVWMGSPTGPVMTLTAARANTAPVLFLNRAIPLGSVAIGYSLAGAGPISTFLGDIYLGIPAQLAAVVVPDPSGRYALGVGTLAPALIGTTVWLHAIDVLAFLPTNHFAVTIF